MSRVIRTTGEHFTTIDVIFLDANFLVFKMDEHLLPALYMREEMNIHFVELVRRTCVESVDINSVDMHKKSWDIILQENEKINLVCPRRQKGTWQKRRSECRGKKREKVTPRS
jgi:hypothetical protein